MAMQGEVFADTKKRLEKRTGFKGKSFEKIKFAVVRRAHFSKPTYLSDGEYSHLPAGCGMVTDMGCGRRVFVAVDE
jgi:hypothetical protein